MLNVRELRNRKIPNIDPEVGTREEAYFQASQELQLKRNRGDDDESNQEFSNSDVNEIVDFDNFENEDVEDVFEQDPENLLDEQELLQSQQLQIDAIIQEAPDLYDMDSQMWISAMASFPSKIKYELTILLFLNSLEKGLHLNHQELADAFAKFLYNDQKTANPKRAPTIYRSWFSHVNKFFILTRKGNLKELVPGIYNSLTDFETGYKATHSRDFTEQNLREYYTLNLEDADYIMRAAYAVAQVSSASRANEGGVTQVFGNVTYSTIVNNFLQYFLIYSAIYMTIRIQRME